MSYADNIRKEIATALEGQEPDDIAIVFLEQLEILLQNDSTYFAGGRGNSLTHTLELTASLVKEASK